MSAAVTGLVWLLSFVAAIVPTVFFVWLFWWLDRYEKEPKVLFLGAFLWGAAPAVVLSLLFESWLTSPLGALSEQVSTVLGSTFVAPPVEELAKGAAVWGIYRWARGEFDGTLDGIVYGAVVGLGFAMVENAFYFASALQSGGLESFAALVPVRSIAFGLNHATFTAFTGVGFARARYGQTRAVRRGAIWAGIGAAIVVHLLHNGLANAGLCGVSLLVNWAGVGVVFVVIALSLRRESEWMRDYLREEVTLGVLSAPLYTLLTTRGADYRQTLARLHRQGGSQARLFGRLASDAAELAQKKHQLDRMGNEQGNLATIARLRERITQEREQLGI